MVEPIIRRFTKRELPSALESFLQEAGILPLEKGGELKGTYSTRDVGDNVEIIAYPEGVQRAEPLKPKKHPYGSSDPSNPVV